MGIVGRLTDQYGLTPETAERLSSLAAEPDGYSPEAMQRALEKYTTKPEDLATAARVNVGSAPSVASTNPNQQPGYSPDAESVADAVETRRKLLAGAPPQGAKKDDFPTVKDMSEQEHGAPMPMQPIQVIPAHWQPGTRAENRTLGMAPSELEDSRVSHDSATGHRLIGADRGLEAAQQRGMADAVYAAAHTAATKQANDKIAANEAEKQAFVASQVSKMNAHAAEMQTKVDPEQYWKEKGTFGKVMASIGMAMGAFGSAISGGRNLAFDIVQGDINQNIKAQVDNIANAKHSFEAQQSLYAQNLARFGDKEKAILTTKINYLDQVKAMADQQYALAGSTANEAAHSDLTAKILDERGRHEEDFAKLTHTQVQQHEDGHYQGAQVVGGGGGGASGKGGKEDHLVPTMGGYARSKEDATALNNKGALRMAMGENMRQIHALMETAKGLSSVTDPWKLNDIQAEIDRLVNDSLTKNTVLEGQGAMSKDDKEVAMRAKGLVGLSVRGKFDGQITRDQVRIKHAADSLLTAHRMDAEAHGIQLGTERYTQGPNGPTPTRVLRGRNKTVTKQTQGVEDLVAPPDGKAR
jgi:hypothetical protein